LGIILLGMLSNRTDTAWKLRVIAARFALKIPQVT
jgi:hypothetical protein